MKRILFVAFLLAFAVAPLAAQRADSDEAAYRRIESRLETTRFDTFIYEEADVADVVRDIARRCGITIIFDRRALEGLSEEDRKITIELVDIRAGNALNIVVSEVRLQRVYRNGVLYIASTEAAAEATVVRVYDVRDITAKVQDFPGPRLRLRGEEGARGPIFEPPQERVIETEDIVDLIEDTVKADWGGRHSIQIVRGVLVVNAPRNVQREVRTLISQLRTAR
jgi:type II secretory pathway component GspD/PulD (secretin)